MAAHHADRRQAAHVHSVEVVSDFRASLAKFADDAQAGVSAADAEVQRWLSWVEDTQLAHWRRELERRRRLMEEARVNLARKAVGRIEDHAPHREEKAAYDRAKRMVAEAEEKLESVQRWARVLRHEFDQYRGAVQGFQDVLSVRIPMARAALDQIGQRLDAYLSTAPPEGTEDGAGWSRTTAARPASEPPDAGPRDEDNEDDEDRAKAT